MPMPFVTVELEKKPLATRLLKRPDAKNAILEVQNLLAAADSIRAVSESDLESALQSHLIRSSATLTNRFENFYAVYLHHCLEDHHLSLEEIEDLKHLKRLLGLADTAVDRIHNEATSRIYKESVAEAVKDGRLDESEREFLESLESNLRLPTKLSQRIHKEVVSTRLQNEIDRVIEDERLSPEEDAEISAIAKSLGTDLEFDFKTRETLDRMRLYWAIENGDVPAVSVDIKLQRSEQCYFAVGANWYEHRRITKSYRYSGPTARIKIAKGIYWRMGQIGVQRLSEDVLTFIDSGYLYLTNKRLIFLGETKNTTIRLQRILGYSAFKNGVEIKKDRGKSPFLEFSENVDLFVLFLERAFRDLG